jgi:hypothetical protein
LKIPAVFRFIYITSFLLCLQISLYSLEVNMLSLWKLQIPGPEEILDLQNYSSEYFRITNKNEICFSLNAAEKGATENAKYVRSELRHILNWSISESHALEGEVRVDSNAEPDKVTVAQIHGITQSGENAPPLLRLALNKGILVAFIKTDNSGEKTDSVVLKKNLTGRYFSYKIEVQKGTMKITVDNDLKITRDLNFWKFNNYFKAGCYPQAVKGNVKVYYRKLSVY